MINWYRLTLRQRRRALRAQGLHVRIRGWLLVIEGGKQYGASFQRRPLVRVPHRTKSTPTRQVPIQRTSFPFYPLF